MKVELLFFGSLENSKEGIKKGLIAFITLIILDLIWFNIIDYSDVVTKKPINIGSALIVWLLLCSAIGVQNNPKNWKESVVYGALVGFVVYGVYNGTNYAILSDWKLSISLIDTLWGVIVCSLASLSVYYFYHSSKYFKNV